VNVVLLLLVAVDATGAEVELEAVPESQLAFGPLTAEAVTC
jgi:hypothetical protein